MGWFGKLVGGAFGLFLGGPVGAALGAAFGHQVDREAKSESIFGRDKSTGDGQQRIQVAFFNATFSIMGHIAKADGRVSEAEIDAARNVMNRLDLTPHWRRRAAELFNQGKQSHFPFDAALEEFRAECHRRPSLIRMFIEVQLEAAYADGALQLQEQRLLLRICERLNFPSFEFHAMKARLDAEHRFADRFARQERPRSHVAPERGPSLSDAYALLGVKPTATDTEIKRAYRRLMSQHHPDKLLASGLSDDKVKLANEKAQKISRAYELITQARKSGS